MNRHEDFKRLRRIGWRAIEAFDAAKIREIFEANENVRLEIVADDGPSATLEDFVGTDQQVEHERQRAENLGVWGMVGEYRLDETFPWAHADSIWGFVGDDWKDSVYDTDIMANTLQTLTDAQVDDLERRRAYLTVRAIRDNAVTVQEFCNGEAGHMLDETEKNAITRILEAIKPHWMLTDL